MMSDAQKDHDEQAARSIGQECKADGSKKMAGMCINWKVVGGLAAIGVAVWITAPQMVAAILPLLILAACPLSMVFMMRAMSGGQKNQRAVPNAPREAGSRDLETLRAEHARLGAELELLEDEQQNRA